MGAQFTRWSSGLAFVVCAWASGCGSDTETDSSGNVSTLAGEDEESENDGPADEEPESEAEEPEPAEPEPEGVRPRPEGDPSPVDGVRPVPDELIDEPEGTEPDSPDDAEPEAEPTGSADDAEPEALDASVPVVDDDAGAPPAPEPTGPPVSGEQCWFEFLGDWVRCEETAYGDDSGTFESLAECSTDCLGDPSCTGIIDYNWIAADLPCHTYDGLCTPSTGVWYEEDAAREYRKVCGDTPPPNALFEFPDETGVRTGTEANCRFDYVGNYQVCENSDAWAPEVTGESFSECLVMCEGRADCTAVAEWWTGGPDESVCALHLSSCDEPTYGEDFGLRYFKKACDE